MQFTSLDIVEYPTAQQRISMLISAYNNLVCKYVSPTSKLIIERRFQHNIAELNNVKTQETLFDKRLHKK